MLTGKLLTALPLDAKTLEAVQARFAKMLGEPVELLQSIDPSLLGGIRVEIAGRVYDDSIRSQLAALKDAALPITRRDSEAQEAHTRRIVREQLREVTEQPRTRGFGRVEHVGDGIASVSGLTDCRYGELLELGGSAYGIAMNLNPDTVDVVLLVGEDDVQSGGEVLGTGRVLSVPTGDALLGRVVNPLGQSLDGKGPIETLTSRPIEAPAPAIIDRQPVNRPMETGLLAVDATVPIGRGQRELIIGDRQTGKTSVAVDAILNQRGKDMLCVYVAIGQKVSTVAQVLETFRKGGAMEYTCVVCSTASDSATMQYIAPYCGCAIAEEFMYGGRDVLIVYDDLSKHAVSYRAMSLLLRRPPGREAYPGDVFYLHSRLLERAAHLSDALGGGSMTALPIVETQTGDISAYIPTNVISITDGQIFLDTELFRSGTRPAVNVGLSVSRVGGAAQTKAIRKVSGPLRLELAQYRELLVFSQFSSDMDAATADMLRYGARLTELLCQRNGAPMSMAVQVAFLYAMTRGLIAHDIDMALFRRFKAEFADLLQSRYPELVARLSRKGELDDELETMLHRAVETWLAEATA